MLYDFLNGHELRRDVGAEFEYSNLAVGMLGHLLALKSGKELKWGQAPLSPFLDR